MISDTKHTDNSGQLVVGLMAYHNYYPFGMEMPDRNIDAGYRYGFNGKEKDKSFEKTNYDYGFRIYNPAIAKFLSVDPLTMEFPMLTPYQFAGNMPIWATDLDGLETHLTNHGVIEGPINTENFAFAIRLDEKVNASEIVDAIRGGTATFSTLAGGMKALANDLRFPKVKSALKIKYFKDVSGQKFTVTLGKRGEGRMKLTGFLKESPVTSELRSAAKSIGDLTFIIDISLLGIDAYEAGKKTYMTGDINNEESGNFLYNASGTALGYYFPISGGIMLLNEITMEKDGEEIYDNLQKHFKSEYYKYKNSDLKKSNSARKSYYENGGTECLGCMKESEVTQAP